MAVPVEQNFSAQTDANGNASYKKAVRGSFWTVVYATAQCAGQGQWVFGKAGTPIAYQQGANVVLGPVYLAPNQEALLQLVGASPNSQVSGTLHGFQGSAQDGSDLVSLAPTLETAGSLTGSVPLSLNGPVPVSDGGLTNSLVAAGSQMHLVKQQALTAGAITHLQVGANFATPYPAGASSWQIIIGGLAGTGFGCRLFVQCYDNASNMLCSRQRDSSQHIYDMIVASGILDTEAMDFQITLPAGAPANCFARLYMTAMTLQDNWYDAAIYEPRVGAPAGTIGYDGVLLWINGATLGAGANAAYNLPTYRGPCQLGIQMSQAGHGSLAENDFLGGALQNTNNFPVSTSGVQQQSLIVFLPAVQNTLTIFNDNGGATNTFYLELRAIKDLMT